MSNFRVFTILLLLLAFGCQNKTAPSNDLAETPLQEEIKEWLTMDGSGNSPHIVLVSGDEEYRSEEALPQLAKILSERHGFKCTVLFAQDPERPGFVDANYGSNIPGLEHLATADLMVLFTRFRALPNGQMKMIDDYLLSGKPVIALRTSTHAFNFNEIDFESDFKHYGNYYDGEDEWKGGFGRLVLGEKWINHHGSHGNQSTRGITAPGAEGHSVFNGIMEGEIWGPTDVYGVRLPMIGDSQPIVLGQTVDRTEPFDENDPRLGMRPTDTQLPAPTMKKNGAGEEIEVDQNDPMMPIVWTKSYQLPGGVQGQALTSTIGSSTDLLAVGTRRLLVNGVFFMLGMDVPEKANVAFVGTYQPSRFAFHDDEYWDEKKMSIAEIGRVDLVEK